MVMFLVPGITVDEEKNLASEICKQQDSIAVETKIRKALADSKLAYLASALENFKRCLMEGETIRVA